MLKRCFALLLIIYIFGFTNNAKEPLFKDCKGYYTVTTGGGSAGKFTTFSTDEMYKFYSVKNITGQSLATYDKGYIDNFLVEYEAEKVFSETVQGIVINYYYSDKIRGYRSINGKKVNIETSDDNGFYTIGSPLIYGGF